MMKIEIDANGPFVVARLSGDLDTLGCETFNTSLQDYAGTSMILDLSRLELIGSNGLGAIINLVVRARAGGRNVILVSPSPFVRGVFETTRLDHWFDISDTLDGAVSRLRQG